METVTGDGRDGPGLVCGCVLILPLTSGSDTGLLAPSPADGFACCLANWSGR